MTDSKNINISSTIVGLLGIAMIGVAIWAMVAPYKIAFITRVDSDLTGDSPKLAISSGVISILLAASVCFVHFSDKKHVALIGLFLILAIVLSISAMSIGIRDINDLTTFAGIKVEPTQITNRIRAVAIVSGISACVQIVELVLVGLSLK